MEGANVQVATIEVGFPHPNGDWAQVEDPKEVERVLRQLKDVPQYDVYSCGEDYDLAYPGYAGDTAYYLEKARQGRVLYLGVGTGRIFLKMLDANPNILGIDRSIDMLRALHGRHRPLAADQVLLCDAADVGLSLGEFDTVVAPFSFLQAFAPATLLAVLCNIRHWLKPGGRFHTDVFSPYLIPFRRKGLEANVRAVGNGTTVATFIQYDHRRQAMRELTLIDGPPEKRLLEMHLWYYFPQQLSALFREAGLREPMIAGGYHGETFDPSENEVLVLETTKDDPTIEPNLNGTASFPRR